jgi:DNA polymerase-3 subunit beta
MTATATATKPKAASGIKFPRTEILAALQAVKPAVPSRSPKSALLNVRIGDGMMTATDLEVRIGVPLGEHCEAFLVPHGRLLEIMRAASGEEVTMTVKESSVLVKCGRGKWTLPTESASEFPMTEPVNLKAVCRLPADQFRRAAHATVYACDTESSRYALGAVLLEVEPTNEGSTQHWVATNGRRLALVETETDQATDARKVLVPARVMKIVAGMAHGDGSIEVEANVSEVVFTTETGSVTGRLTEGQFPRWRDVIGEPEGEPSVIEVADLKSCVRSAAIVTSEQSKGVDLAWSNGSLVISARSSEYGESQVKCPVVAAGSTSATKVDPRFVIEFLDSLPPDGEPEVDLYATDPESRVMLRCGDITGIVMPLAAD